MAKVFTKQGVQICRVHQWVTCLGLLLCLAGLSACGNPAGLSPQDMNLAYETVLQETAPPKAQVFAAGSAAEQAALVRLEAYFADMTAASVAAQTATVYAPDAWLYDNLAIVEGAPAIEAYFLKSAADTDALRVEFLQVLHDGPDYFVRWRMVIQSEALNNAEAMISYGMTQFRFDQQGRVLVHRDFWDAATGLYEYLPVLGRIVRGARGALTGDDA